MASDWGFHQLPEGAEPAMAESEIQTAPLDRTPNSKDPDSEVTGSQSEYFDSASEVEVAAAQHLPDNHSVAPPGPEIAPLEDLASIIAPHRAETAAEEVEQQHIDSAGQENEQGEQQQRAADAEKEHGQEEQEEEEEEVRSGDDADDIEGDEDGAQDGGNHQQRRNWAPDGIDNMNPNWVRSADAIEESYSCKVCFDTPADNERVFLDCGHIFCTSCLNSNFRNAMLSRENFPPKCCQRRAIDLTLVQIYLEDDVLIEVMEKWEEWSAPDPTYCQTPGCTGGMIPEERFEGQWATCRVCSNKTCIECKALESAHITADEHPNTLSEEDRQLARNQGWRQCPKCRKLIERIDGCDHMTCSACTTEFCYRCGASLQHGLGCNCQGQNQWVNGALADIGGAQNGGHHHDEEGSDEELDEDLLDEDEGDDDGNVDEELPNQPDEVAGPRNAPAPTQHTHTTEVGTGTADTNTVTIQAFVAGDEMQLSLFPPNLARNMQNPRFVQIWNAAAQNSWANGQPAFFLPTPAPQANGHAEENALGPTVEQARADRPIMPVRPHQDTNSNEATGLAGVRAELELQQFEQRRISRGAEQGEDELAH